MRFNHAISKEEKEGGNPFIDLWRANKIKVSALPFFSPRVGLKIYSTQS